MKTDNIDESYTQSKYVRSIKKEFNDPDVYGFVFHFAHLIGLGGKKLFYRKRKDECYVNEPYYITVFVLIDDLIYEITSLFRSIRPACFLESEGLEEEGFWTLTVALELYLYGRCGTIKFEEMENLEHKATK